MNQIIASQLFLWVAFAVLVILFFLMVKPAPTKASKYVFLTDENDVTDKMQLQAVYLARRLYNLHKVNSEDLQKEFEAIKKDMKHFRRTFGRVSGFYSEWNDLSLYLHQQEATFSGVIGR